MKSVAENFATSHAVRSEEYPNEENEYNGVFRTGGGDRSRDGGCHRASSAAAKVTKGSIAVALFENSLQMELRDPFDLDGGSSGLQAEFSCGERIRQREWGRGREADELPSRL